MVDFIIKYYLVQLILIIGISILSWLFWDKRFRKNHGKQVPAGYERTDEASIDPVTGKVLRVYYNKQTGERFYKEEGGKS